jgi:hypothetical protein
MKIMVGVLLLSVAAATVAVGQKASCSTGIPPVIRGLKLGMTIEDLSFRLKGIRIAAPNRQGQQSFVLTFSPNPLKFREGIVNLENSSIISTAAYPEFEGAAKVGLDFMDGQLYSITIYYQDSVKWRNVDEFVALASGPLGVPSSAWLEDAQRDNVRNLNCDKFQMRAKIEGSQAALLLFDPSAPLIMAARKAELEEKRRGSFKP